MAGDLGAARVIDTHTHWRPADYGRMLLRQAELDPAFAREQAPAVRSVAAHPDADRSLAELHAQLEAAQVDIAFVSLPPPAVSFGDAGFAAEAAARTNDALIEAAGRCDGRLRALVSLPLPAQGESLAELDRVAGSPLVAGVQVLATGASASLAPDASEPVLARAAELGLAVVVHPSLEPLPETYADWMLAASLAPVVSSSLAVARLVLAGVLDRLPDLRVVVPHLGGILPYVSQRIMDFGRGEAEHDFGWYLEHRLYADTCSFHPPALRCAVETMGADRLVLGSDHPNRGPLARAVADVTGFFGGEERDRVLGGTARAVFGRRTPGS